MGTTRTGILIPIMATTGRIPIMAIMGLHSIGTAAIAITTATIVTTGTITGKLT